MQFNLLKELSLSYSVRLIQGRLVKNDESIVCKQVRITYMRKIPKKIIIYIYRHFKLTVTIRSRNQLHDQQLHMYVSEADRRNLNSFLTLVYLKRYDVINIVSDRLCAGFQRKGKGEVRSYIPN